MKNNRLFECAAIFGVGLIGGSLARVLKNRNLAERVLGVGRGKANMDKALELGIIDETLSPEKAAEKADLIVLCTPVLSVIPMLEKIAPSIRAGAIVTDAGSTKGGIVAKAEKIAAGKFAFVGSHPIAGTEKSGAEHSFETLFENKRCVLTPTKATAPADLEKIKGLWEAAGMRVTLMDPAEHDRVFGAVSHLPHLVAYSLVNLVGGLEGGEDLLGFAGGGFRDITRIASSPPEMWADIAMENREVLCSLLDKYSGRLDAINHAIRTGDKGELLSEFAKANRYREKVD